MEPLSVPLAPVETPPRGVNPLAPRLMLRVLPVPAGFEVGTIVEGHSDTRVGRLTSAELRTLGRALVELANDHDRRYWVAVPNGKAGA